MKATAENYGHAVILNLNSEMTEDTLGAFKQEVDRQLAGNKEIIDLVLNLENVPFIDSAVLEYLLDLQDRLAEKLGQVRLANCDLNILKILEMTRLASTFEICRDVQEAVKSI